MPTPAQNKATAKYIKNHMRRFMLSCNNEKDADIIEFLERSDNVNALLKELIREKISSK